MFFGLSHVDVPVRDLARARELYERALGFAVVHAGDGFVDLDAASTKLRLYESARVERPASIRIESNDVEGDVQVLVGAGATVTYAAARTPRNTVEGTLRDPDGNTITVWRALSEDEYDAPPELPKERGWHPDAEALLKSLLRAVPALFRPLARWKVVREAETRAGPSGHVGRELVIRSFISAQSRPNRKRLLAPLREHGIDPDAYRDEFES